MDQDRKPRVLIVDDSRTQRLMEEKILTDLGCVVEAAEDGLSGLKAVMQEGGFDLILLDLGMPKMNGHDFLREIKKNPDTAEMKILVLSGKDEEEVIQSIKEGADEYWLKGSSPFMLKHKIRSLLRVSALEGKLQRIQSLLGNG